MDNPLVTVFIPVYNCENYICESLESIINQSYTNLEILLVDDGSTDMSVEKIKSYSDKRIRLIHNEQNMGIPYTRNVGLKEANGQYIVVMDSDDIAMPNRVERQVNYLQYHPEIDAVGSYYIKFGGRFTRKIKSKYITDDLVKIALLFYNPIANPSSAFRRNVIDRYNMKYNPDYFVAQDYDFWAQLSKVGKISIIPEFLLKYRSGHENITKKSKKEKLEKRKEIINQIHTDLLDYYKFRLDNEDLNLYNQFFLFNNEEIEDKDKLIKLINKLRQVNNNNKIFDQEKFNNILDNAIVTAILHLDKPINYKLELYRELVKNAKVNKYIIIYVKHFYHRLSKII